MAICNRDLDVTLQNVPYQANVPLTAVGASTIVPLVFIAMQSKLKAVSISNVGVSGAVIGALAIQRFVPGAGATAILLGSTLALVNVGTSGAQNFTLPASGSTLLQLQRGDQLALVLAGGNNILSAQAALVLQSLQDLTSPLGINS